MGCKNEKERRPNNKYNNNFHNNKDNYNNFIDDIKENGDNDNIIKSDITYIMKKNDNNYEQSIKILKNRCEEKINKLKIKYKQKIEEINEKYKNSKIEAKNEYNNKKLEKELEFKKQINNLPDKHKMLLEQKNSLKQNIQKFDVNYKEKQEILDKKYSSQLNSIKNGFIQNKKNKFEQYIKNKKQIINKYYTKLNKARNDKINSEEMQEIRDSLKE